MKTGRKAMQGAQSPQPTAGRRPALPHERGVLQPKAAAPQPSKSQPPLKSAQPLKSQPAAPPVYRPQTTPKVLQTKKAAGALQTPAPHLKRANAAPPTTGAAHGPVLQAKAFAARPPGAFRPPGPTPAPPARRTLPHEVVQAKPACAHARPAQPRSAVNARPGAASRGTGRAPAAPFPSSPRAAGARAIQRDTLLDIERLEELRSISRVLRGYGKAKGADSNEFQGMRYGSQILVTGNTQADTNTVFAGLESVSGREAYSHFSLMGHQALKRGGSGEAYDTQTSDPELSSEIIRDLAVKKNRLLDERFSSNTVNPALAAGMLGSGGPSLILVGGMGGGGLHAEQRLLVALANKLSVDDDVPDSIHLGGSKPPCTRCQPVVEAFETGLKRFYGTKLNYVKTGTRKTCGGEVAQITVADLPAPGHGSPAAYGKLIEFLTTALG